MRELARVSVTIIAVLVLGWIGYRIAFPTDRVDPLLVLDVEGNVQHIDGEGRRSAAVPGLSLKPLDRIEAMENGRATLIFGNTNSIQVQRETSIRILGVSEQGVRIELEEGRIEATVRPGHGAIGVVSRGKEITSTNADFAVGVNASGAVAMESRMGEVQILGMEGIDSLKSGQRVLSLPDGSTTVTSIPESLLLEVAWPATARTREAEIAVRGRTDPGAEVKVGTHGYWKVVIAGKDGHFEAAVPLAEGANKVEVISQDPLGRRAMANSELVRDSQSLAGATFEVHY